MSLTSSTDRVERNVIVNAPRTRVWRALSDAQAFGAWFGVNLAGQNFGPGANVRGPMTSCGHEHVIFDAIIERVEPERLLSYRWHPYAVDPAVDYSAEVRTLVVFTLEERGASTLVRVVESGFDNLPPERRATALKMHSQGWVAQLNNVKGHAETH